MQQEPPAFDPPGPLPERILPPIPQRHETPPVRRFRALSTRANRSDARPGGCLCGAIRYRFTGDPVTLYACHCTDCQTSTGSSYALSMLVPRESIEALRGKPELCEVDLPDGRRKRAFRCASCGTHLWGAPQRVPQILNLHPGTLDDTSWFEPVGHIWTRSAQPWVRIPTDTLCYQQQPEDMLPLVRAWKARSTKLALA